ncbi:MAG: rod shape-determining protein [Candidatus Vogelbacteria bacterium CG10_big_fil_rev_8_21_14_0_10_49_38]|uniref:Cell shape-determining protein MreB n=1 Tax=Candidatus Vogelbacteria bacterium CG10_big_fil_rev_8_21_14_0_10_49_38 TaxID=1975043 RepID=A0A2H0RHG9_9BACT|nr:MAG: rod shape-determining protein [bacterium CG10_49_38]PIR45979.1 MAG: rod shape-determining protein [Candidatus Vogelbacteria bacterium CG10_big_fil_rev_8_21_14_0_10_49_38]
MSIFTTKLGIDLGTANTLVYVPGQGIVLNEPSVVAVSLMDNKVVAVGVEAREMVGRAPDTIMVYKPMKDGVIADYRITEAMLHYYITKALGRFNIFKPDVMVSVPAGVTSTERRAVIEATMKAGAKNAYVVKEPILAAIGAGIPIYDACGHIVVDIGGGTTDVAVISLGGIVSSTSVKHAGNKIDQAIADYIKKNFNLAIGDRTAEEVKLAISSAIPLDDELSYLIKGRDFVTGLPRSVEIRTNEIVRAIDNELKEIIRAIKVVFQDTPPELSADVIDQGIILTGGSSQLRNLAELIYRKTGVKTYLADEAIYCVAKGTGIALEHLDVYKRSIISKR